MQQFSAKELRVVWCLSYITTQVVYIICKLVCSLVYFRVIYSIRVILTRQALLSNHSNARCLCQLWNLGFRELISHK